MTRFQKLNMLRHSMTQWRINVTTQEHMVTIKHYIENTSHQALRSVGLDGDIF